MQTKVTRRSTQIHSDKNSHHTHSQSQFFNFSLDHQTIPIIPSDHIHRTYTTHDQTTRSHGLYIIKFDIAHRATGGSSLVVYSKQ